MNELDLDLELELEYEYDIMGWKGIEFWRYNTRCLFTVTLVTNMSFLCRHMNTWNDLFFVM